MKWISMKDKKPSKKMKEVITFEWAEDLEGEKIYHICIEEVASLHFDEQRVYSDGGGENIIFWMPMPRIPCARREPIKDTKYEHVGCTGINLLPVVGEKSLFQCMGCAAFFLKDTTTATCTGCQVRWDAEKQMWYCASHQKWFKDLSGEES